MQSVPLDILELNRDAKVEHACPSSRVLVASRVRSPGHPLPLRFASSALGHLWAPVAPRELGCLHLSALPSRLFGHCRRCRFLPSILPACFLQAPPGDAAAPFLPSALVHPKEAGLSRLCRQHLVLIGEARALGR